MVKIHAVEESGEESLASSSAPSSPSESGDVVSGEIVKQRVFMADDVDAEEEEDDGAAPQKPRFSQTPTFQLIAVCTIWLSVINHCTEWSRDDMMDKESQKIHDIIRFACWAFFAYELQQRLVVWLDVNCQNIYSSDQGLFLDFVVMCAYGLGSFVLPLVTDTFMKPEANFNDMIAYARIACVFRMTRMPMIMAKIMPNMQRVALAASAALEVMIWPLFFVICLAFLFGGCMIVGIFELSDNINPELFDNPIGWQLKGFMSSSSATWMGFRLILIDTGAAWNVMEQVEPMVTVPVLLMYMIIIRTAVNIMLFMIVLERVSKFMTPIDMAEAERGHIGAFMEVQSLFTDPPTPEGFLILSEKTFFDNLPACPRLMECFEKLGLTPTELPYLYRVLAEPGVGIKFRKLAMDYSKIAVLVQEAEAIAAGRMCVDSAERIWLFCALLDSQRLHRLQEVGVDKRLSVPVPAAYSDFTFGELAEIARGESPSKPTPLQTLVLDVTYNLIWAGIVLINLGYLYVQYTLPQEERNEKIWCFLDLAFLGLYLGESLVRIKAWGPRMVLPWNRPWLFIDCAMAVNHVFWYVVYPIMGDTFLTGDDTHYRYGRVFEVIKGLRLMRATLALRKYPFWNPFVRLNFMVLSNASVVLQWFMYMTCWAFIFGFHWHYFVGTGRFFMNYPGRGETGGSDELAAGLAMRFNTPYGAVFQIYRHVWNGPFVFMPIVGHTNWTGILELAVLLGCQMIIANLLGGLLLVNIEKNRKIPELLINVDNLIAEYGTVLKRFGCDEQNRNISYAQWLRGASGSLLFVPALIKIHMVPEDIPGLYWHLDIDKSDAVSAIEFLVMYRHIKKTANDSMTTSIIELARSTAERATYLLAAFDRPPNKDALSAIFDDSMGGDDK